MANNHRRKYFFKLGVIVSVFLFLSSILLTYLVLEQDNRFDEIQKFIFICGIQEIIGVIMASAIHWWVIKPIIETIHHTRHISEHDGMTGLFNRLKFKKRTDEYNKCDSIGVIFIDVNELKKANDLYGHEAGDELLCSISKSIKSLQFKNLDSYRFGGDEFVIVLINSTEEQVKEKQKEFLDKVEKISLKLSPIKASVACGIAFSSAPIDIEYLIKRADNNMYRHKKNQKNK